MCATTSTQKTTHKNTKKYKDVQVNQPRSKLCNNKIKLDNAREKRTLIHVVMI